jgi:redox-sensitive bicupin YhaK (pirin superfamily)
LKPSYDQATFEPSQWKNQLFPVASGQGMPGAVTFHTDATIYRADLDTGREVELSDKKNRCVFIYVTKGSLALDGHELGEKDQARVTLTGSLALKAVRPSEFILIDVPPRKD